MLRTIGSGLSCAPARLLRMAAAATGQAGSSRRTQHCQRRRQRWAQAAQPAAPACACPPQSGLSSSRGMRSSRWRLRMSSPSLSCSLTPPPRQRCQLPARPAREAPTAVAACARSATTGTCPAPAPATREWLAQWRGTPPQPRSAPPCCCMPPSPHLVCILPATAPPHLQPACRLLCHSPCSDWLSTEFEPDIEQLEVNSRLTPAAQRPQQQQGETEREAAVAALAEGGGAWDGSTMPGSQPQQGHQQAQQLPDRPPSSGSGGGWASQWGSSCGSDPGEGAPLLVLPRSQGQQHPRSVPLLPGLALVSDSPEPAPASRSPQVPAPQQPPPPQQAQTQPHTLFDLAGMDMADFLA